MLYDSKSHHKIPFQPQNSFLLQQGVCQFLPERKGRLRSKIIFIATETPERGGRPPKRGGLL